MKIEIYSKDNCGYCVELKHLFKFHNLEYTEYSLNNGYTKDDIQQRVGDTKQINVVPQVFIDNQYIGSYLDVIKYFAYDKHIINL